MIELKNRIIKNYCGVSGEDFLHVTKGAEAALEKKIGNNRPEDAEIEFVNDEDFGGYGCWFVNVRNDRDDKTQVTDQYLAIKDNILFAQSPIR